MNGLMPYSVLDSINSEFGPAFQFDRDAYEFVSLMWSNARSAADLVSEELGVENEDGLDAIATKRVVDAFRVLLYGERVGS